MISGTGISYYLKTTCEALCRKINVQTQYQSITLEAQKFTDNNLFTSQTSFAIQKGDV